MYYSQVIVVFQENPPIDDFTIFLWFASVFVGVVLSYNVLLGVVAELDIC